MCDEKYTKADSEISKLIGDLFRNMRTQKMELATGHKIVLFYVCRRYCDVLVDGRDCGRLRFDDGQKLGREAVSRAIRLHKAVSS